MRDLPELADALKPIAARASAAILEVYAAGFAVHRKDDDSPVTLADLESQRIILAGLAEVTPDVPVLSEESVCAPWDERRHWQELWIVDPLDGTREFVKRNGEFAINIALVVANEPVLGLVSVPTQGLLYWGAAGVGAFTHHQGQPQRSIRVSPPARPVRVVGSRWRDTQSRAYLEKLRPHVVTGVGSSIKFCLLAEGKADLYVRFGPTSEWDTAAGQALLEAAGGHVTRLDGHRMRYNCRESLLNGNFLAYNHPSVLEPD